MAPEFSKPAFEHSSVASYFILIINIFKLKARIPFYECYQTDSHELVINLCSFSPQGQYSELIDSLTLCGCSSSPPPLLCELGRAKAAFTSSSLRLKKTATPWTKAAVCFPASLRWCTITALSVCLSTVPNTWPCSTQCLAFTDSPESQHIWMICTYCTCTALPTPAFFLFCFLC